MRSIIYIPFFIFILLSCSRGQYSSGCETIDVATCVDTYNVLHLSDYVESIEYILLETNDDILISKIDQIAFENGKIIVSDNVTSLCHVFDSTGKWLHSVGKVGQGPEEYIALQSFDVNPQSNTISVQAYPGKLLTYDIDTKGLIEKIDKMSLPNDLIMTKALCIEPGLYFSDIVSYDNTRIKNVLFGLDEAGAIIKSMYSNSSFIDKENKDGYSASFEAGTIYRYKDHIRCYKVLNDTIFNLNKDLNLEKAFVFDFGTYRAGNEWLLERVRDRRMNFIYPLKIQESSEFLFFEFFFGEYAPAPFEYIKDFNRGVDRVKAINYNVLGLYEKGKGILNLMEQPVKGELGFKNDIDKGITLWPYYISSDNRLVSYCNAADFIDHYSKIPDPSDNVVNILNTITEDSNPVIIISKVIKKQENDGIIVKNVN